MAIDYCVIVADATRLDDVEPLFKAMVEHHRRVAGEQWPVRNGDQAWDRRRRQYTAWLSSGKAWLLLAVNEISPQEPAAGYAMVRLTEPGPTWDLGEAVGELESLAVAEPARGQGTGTRLMDAARDLLRAQGVGYCRLVSWRPTQEPSVSTSGTGSVRTTRSYSRDCEATDQPAPHRSARSRALPA